LTVLYLALTVLYLALTVLYLALTVLYLALTVFARQARRTQVQALLAAGHYKLWQTAECDSCLASAAAGDGLASEALGGGEGFRLARTAVKNLVRAGRPAEALRRLDTILAQVLKYEPSSEPLHISVKWLFLN